MWSHFTKCNNSIITATLPHAKQPLTQPRQVVNNEGLAGLVVEIYISYITPTGTPMFCHCETDDRPIATTLLRYKHVIFQLAPLPRQKV
jgi:hypothetical protein